MELVDADVLLVRNQRRSSHSIANRPDPDDPQEPLCDPYVHREDASYHRVLADRLPANYRLCKHCDPDHEVNYGPEKGQGYLANALKDVNPGDPIADGGQEVVTIPREHAETLLEAAGTLRDDIANGRQWGFGEPASRENARALEDAHAELQEELREEEVATDGGTDDVDDGPFYLVDEADAVVVAGPFDTHDEATDELPEHDGHLITATETVLQLIEMTSTTSLTWANEDEDEDEVAMDGGVTMLESQAAKKVPDILDAVEKPTSQQFEDRATPLARDAELKHPINRSPSAVAAGAVYAAGLLENEPVSQKMIAAASDVQVATIRNTYREILEQEGIPIEESSTSRRPDSPEDSRGFLARLRRVVFRD